LGIIAADLQTFSDFTFCNFTETGTAMTVTNLTTVGGILPQTSAWVPDYGLFFLSLGLDGKEYASIVDLAGKVLFHQGYVNQVLTNAAYDTLSQEYFINAYDSTHKMNYLTQLFPNNNSLIQQLKISGIVQVDISTYSSQDHIFFLTLQTPDGSGNALIQIDTQAKTLLSHVVVEDAIEILMWDDIGKVMYAWVADENYAGVLVILDLITGRRTKTIIQFENYSANGGTAALMATEKIVYASLIDIGNGDELPIWVVVDITTGNYTAKHTNLNVGFPINLFLF
jgi:hypothetical protein